MVCKSCGNENRDGARFCSKCGASLGLAPATKEKRNTIEVVEIAVAVILFIIILVAITVMAFMPYLKSKFDKVQSSVTTDFVSEEQMSQIINYINKTEQNDDIAEKTETKFDEKINIDSREKSIKELLAEMGYDNPNRYEISYEDYNEDGLNEVIVVDNEDACLHSMLFTYYNGKLNNIFEWEEPSFGFAFNYSNTPYFGEAAYSSYFQEESIYTITDGEIVDVASIYVTNMIERMDDYELPSEYEATIAGKVVSIEEFWNYVYTILPAENVDSMYNSMMLDEIEEY